MFCLKQIIRLSYQISQCFRLIWEGALCGLKSSKNIWSNEKCGHCFNHGSHDRAMEIATFNIEHIGKKTIDAFCCTRKAAGILNREYMWYLWSVLFCWQGMLVVYFLFCIFCTFEILYFYIFEMFVNNLVVVFLNCLWTILFASGKKAACLLSGTEWEK